MSYKRDADSSRDSATFTATRSTEPNEASVDWDAGSFRDPGGFIFQVDGRVFRAITRHSLEDWKCFSASPLFQEHIPGGPFGTTASSPGGLYSFGGLDVSPTHLHLRFGRRDNEGARSVVTN